MLSVPGSQGDHPGPEYETPSGWPLTELGHKNCPSYFLTSPREPELGDKHTITLFSRLRARGLVETTRFPDSALGIRGSETGPERNSAP